MKKRHMMTILSVFCLVTSCGKSYLSTRRVCDSSLYVEKFRVSYWGEDVDYLTDSVNFRLNTGRIDEEHERLIYICENGIITIFKERYGDRDTLITLPNGKQELKYTYDTLARKSFILKQLIEQHKFDK